MDEAGSSPSWKAAMAIVLPLTLGVLLLVAFVLVAEWITAKQATMTFLLIAGTALLLTGIVRLGHQQGVWRWLRETAERAMSTDSDGNVDDTGLYRFALLAAGFTLAAIPLAVLSAMAIWELSFADIVPYLLAAITIALLVLALMAISYAPPGPNWIHRIAGIDGRALLVMVGIAVVVLGTLQFFEYESDGSAPTDWWLGVVAIGLLIGLVGLSRRRGSETPPDRPTSRAQQVRQAADEARRQSALAEAARMRAEIAAPNDDDAYYREAARAAAAAASSADKAERAAARVAATEAEIAGVLAETTRDAQAAEVAAKAARRAADQLKEAASVAEQSEG